MVDVQCVRMQRDCEERNPLLVWSDILSECPLPSSPFSFSSLLNQYSEALTELNTLEAASYWLIQTYINPAMEIGVPGIVSLRNVLFSFNFH